MKFIVIKMRKFLQSFQSKTLRLIFALVLLSLCGFGLKLLQRHTPRNELPGAPLQPSATIGSAGQTDAGPALIFAGLSGQSPRYIESGPDKGLGYLDQDSRGVRKALAQDGFHIVQEWMTPARIAHEFRIKSPICIYPTEWSRPQDLFAKPQDRVYSIPLSLGGDENRFILVKKTDVPRFKKHFDDKGSVRMTSLIDDAELKTLLIRDKDYGDLGRILTEVDAQGDQVVREKFKKHIGILLFNDSRQVVEMLNASRFDYLLADEIEDQNWTDAKVDASQFVRINFSSASVKGIDDPNIIYRSVSCSLHPLSIRAMPHINQWIASNRGVSWSEKSFLRKAQRQKSQLAGGSAWAGSVINQFRGQFDSGDLDGWYGLQQKQIPSLQLFPDEPIQTESDSPRELEEVTASFPKHPLWHAKTLEAKKLLIWNDSSGAILPTSGSYTSRIEFVQAFNGMPALNLLSASELDLLETQSTSGTASFSRALWTGEGEVEKLTLFAKGLASPSRSSELPRDSSQALSDLLPILKNGHLKELTVIGANPAASEWLVENLPEHLQVLNLISCALSQTKIHLKLSTQSLRELRLDNSQLQTHQFQAMLPALSSKIEVLSLGHSRVLWTLELAQAFGRLSWPKLRELNLEQSTLNDEEFLEIQKRIPQGLEVLNLGNSCLSMKSLGILFKLPFVKLRELNLSGSDLNTRNPIAGVKLNFPQHLKRLKLAGMSLTPKQTMPLVLPSGLEDFDLEDNPLRDEALVPLLSQLTSTIERLNLRKTGSGLKTLQLIGRQKWGALRSLALSWNLIGDPGLAALKDGGLRFLHLDLGHTGLTKQGLEVLGETWAKELLSLDLSGNAFRPGDLGLFYPKLNSNLRELSLGSNTDLDVESLARTLPQTLRKLDLSNAQLSNSEIIALAPQLPKSLRILNVSGSGFGAEGARALGKFLPQNLEDLNLTAVAGLGNVLRRLPQSLRLLKISGSITSRYSEAQVKEMAKALPEGLEDLWLIRIQAEGGISDLLSSLPSGLSRLRIYNTDLNQKALSNLNRAWPSSLRELFFQGTQSSKSHIELSRVPHTIERLGLFVAGFEATELDAIAESQLQNLHYFQLSKASLPVHRLQELLRKTHRLRGFELLHVTGISPRDLLQLRKSDLDSVFALMITNVSIGNRSMQHLLSILPKHLSFLNFSSTGLTAQGFDSLVPLLPRNLRDLYLPGNSVGQKGLELLRKELARRDALGEPLFGLGE